MTSNMARKICLIGASLVAISSPGAVWAQASSAANTAPTGPGTQAGQPAVGETGGIADIIVTAQRREQKLQSVPISIVALSAARLTSSGVTSTGGLATQVPGLVLTRVGVNAVPFLRGIGSTSATVGTEQAVGSYIDGVYMMDNSSAIYTLNNLARLEVLKGPQGTLFGRNTTGGVINAITRDPTVKPTVEGNISYGNYQTVQGALYASGGSGNVAADIAVSGINQGKGFGRNIFLNSEVGFRKEFSIRSKILWNMGPDDRLTLSGDWGYNKTDVGFQFNALPGAILVGGATRQGGPYDTNTDLPTRVLHSSNWGGSVKYEHNLEHGKVTILSAYRRNDINATFDLDASPGFFVEQTRGVTTNETFQNEVIYNGSNAKLDWTAGLFFFSATSRDTPMSLRGVPAAANTDLDATQETKSYAAFGQATYKVTATTNFTAGVRYTIDKRAYAGTRFSAPGNASPVGTILTQNISDVTFKSPTWRLAIDQKLGEDVMIYASYNRGYRSGLYNLTGNTGDGPVKPETLDAFEGGIKSEFLDHHLRFNLSAFHYDEKNIQVKAINNGISKLINAAAGRINGLDLETVAEVPLGTGKLRLSGTLSLLDAKYTSFPGGPIGTPKPTGGTLITFGDLSGHTMVRAPKASFTVAANYTVPVADGSLDLNVNYFHSGSFYWEADNRVSQAAYGVLDAQIAYSFGEDGRYKVRVFGSNLTKAYYYVAALTTNAPGDMASPAEPRTYGVGIGFKF